MTARTPLDLSRITDALVHTGTYSRVIHKDVTGSTNTDLAAAAREGAAAYTAELAEFQNAGRGRHGRAWVAPVGSQLILSVVIRPAAASLEYLGLLPLATGLAVLDGLEGVRKNWPATDAFFPTLKWPNDVLLGGRKLCGILGEAVDLGANPALVMGLGLNVSLTQQELPVPHATSLDLAAGGESGVDRTQLAIDILRAMRKRLDQWGSGKPEQIRDLMEDYRKVCSSIGQEVKVLLPGDEELLGTAVGVDDSGHIVVEDKSGTRHALAAGDVTHLRLRDGSHGKA